jgi:hypothetical protein
MSRPDNSHLVIAAARRRAAATRKRAVTALRRMENAGAPITFDAVARRALLTELRGGSPHVNGDVVASGATVSACDWRR